MKETRALAGSQKPPGGADLRRLLKIDVESELFPATPLKSAGQQINADKLINIAGKWEFRVVRVTMETRAAWQRM